MIKAMIMPKIHFSSKKNLTCFLENQAKKNMGLTCWF